MLWIIFLSISAQNSPLTLCDFVSIISINLLMHYFFKLTSMENALKLKSYAFALRIVGASKYLTESKEYILSKQLLRSGTAVGALIREAEFAQSPADFISKMSIALKEANETSYWLSILKDTKYIEGECSLNCVNTNSIYLCKWKRNLIMTSTRAKQ